MSKPTQITELGRIADALERLADRYDDGVASMSDDEVREAVTETPTRTEPMGVTPEAAAEVVAEHVAAEAEANRTECPGPPVSTPLTFDEVRAAMCEMVKEKGEEAAAELLAEFDAAKLSDVPAERWAGLIEKAVKWPMPQAEPEGVTSEEVMGLLQAVIEKCERDVAKDLLAQFNAVSFSKLSPDNYEAFATAARKKLA